ncbi:MAG: ATP-binding cassette domain-containing protein [Parvularculaceae bacterium]
MTAPLMRVEDLAVYYPVRTGGVFIPKIKPLKAVDGVSFHINPGETLGVVGESGCGKSTLSRAILKFAKPHKGAIYWGDININELSARDMNALRRDIQIVFQSPLASLNPRMTVGDVICEPLEVFETRLSKEERIARMRDIMQEVGLYPEMANRFPNEFSGGQCQRISIARAMILNPKLLICDEAVSALDVSIKAQIINLLKKLQRETGIAILFISHDLAIVRQISHRVMVMYLGKPMEVAPSSELFANPLHPYTKALLEAAPYPDPVKERAKNITPLSSDLPSPMAPPSGCVFRTRCPITKPNCISKEPSLDKARRDHFAACHFVERNNSVEDETAAEV